MRDRNPRDGGMPLRHAQAGNVRDVKVARAAEEGQISGAPMDGTRPANISETDPVAKNHSEDETINDCDSVRRSLDDMWADALQSFERHVAQGPGSD